MLLIISFPLKGVIKTLVHLKNQCYILFGIIKQKCHLHDFLFCWIIISVHDLGSVIPGFLTSAIIFTISVVAKHEQKFPIKWIYQSVSYRVT